jgi:hypothetical protein
MSIFERVETAAIPARFTACSADPSRLWNEDVIVDEVLALAVEEGCLDADAVPRLFEDSKGLFWLCTGRGTEDEPFSELSEALFALISESDYKLQHCDFDCDCCEDCGHGVEHYEGAGHCHECERSTGHAHRNDCRH